MNIKTLFSGVVLSVLFLSVWCADNVNCPKPDADETRTVPELIESRGFKAETYYVTTDDGYILTIHRIVNEKSKVKVKRPVILQHGLFSSGYDFIINSAGLGTDNSETFYENKLVSNNLGFALALYDFDVWIANSRGNVYGKNHTTLDPEKDKKFWEFTFDEMIKFDLPAVIAFIQNNTNHATVGYIGHSQGTLIMFALLSERPEYSEIIKPFIALAPVAKVAHIKSPIRYLAENPLLMDLFYYKGGPFFPSNDLINYMAEQFCKFEVISDLCSNVLFLFAGYDSQQLNITRLPVYIAHAPSTTSAWNVIHFGQLVVSNKFRKFDFGTVGNLRHYGTMHPPEYNLSRITSKSIAIIHSTNDWLADPEDVLFIQQQLEGKLMLDHKIPYEKWNHLDFVWGKKASKYVNVIVIDILKKFKSESFLKDNLV